MNEIESFGINFEQIKIYFFKGIRYWYILLLFLVIGASHGYFKTRYNIPSFEVSGRILVKDEWKQGADAFLPGMEIVGERNRLANEVGIIKSFPLMLEVVKSIPDLKVNYYDVGNVKKTDLYKSSPFHVNIVDSITSTKIYNKLFTLKFISKTEYLLSLDDFDKDNGTKYLFGETIYLAGTKATIQNQTFYPEIKDKKFQFYINDLEALAKYYQDITKLTVDIDEASSILIASLKGTNYLRNIDVINGIMLNFIEYGIKEGNEKGVNTLNFVNNTLKNVADSLHIAENRLESFKKTATEKRIDIHGEHLISKVTELEIKKLELDFTLEFSENTINYIKNNNDAKGIIVPYFINRNSVLYDLMTNLIDKYNKKESLTFQIEESSTAMEILNHEIEVAKSILLKNLVSLKNKSENDLSTVLKQLELLDQKIKVTPTSEKEYAIALRNYNIQDKLYTYLLEKRQEAEIAKASNIPKASVLDYANKYRVKKIGTANINIIQKYLFIYFFLSLIFIVIIEFFNNKIIDKVDIEKITQIPILGYIGHNTENNNLILFSKPKSLISEAFRAIRTNIQYISHKKGCKIILLTSSVSGEGKTFCSMNIACSNAFLNKKTILIGADLRKPKIFDDFGLNNEVGLSTLLIGKATLKESIQKTEHEYLDLITSGPIPPNPSELLSSNSFHQLIKELKTQYERIVIDTSPIGLVTDARIIIDLADVVLLVVRQKYTTYANLKKINKELSYCSEKCGLIVNDIKQKRIGYGRYGYEYGYGYGYGNYGYGYYNDDVENENN